MRTRRLIGATVATAMGLSLYLVALVPMAVADDGCTLTATPAIAAAGTEFTLRGSGFTPADLTLQKEGGQPVTIELDLGDDDPFEIPIGSNTGDEGVWHATAVGDECSAETSFTVTLQNTDAIDDLLGSVGSAPLPTALALGVILVGFAAGMLLGRRTRRA